MMADSDEGKYDVLVAGGGFGGLVAGATAAELGARVAVVEADREVGGTALISGGLLHINDPASWEEFRRVFPTIDPELGRVLFDGFPELVTWLGQRIGAPLAPVDLHVNPYGPDPRRVRGYLIGATPMLLSARPALRPLATLAYKITGDRFLTFLDWLAIRRVKRRFIAALASALGRHGGEIIAGARVTEVARDAARGAQVRVDTPLGARELGASAVILASGGFQGNAGLLRRYLGEGGVAAMCRATPSNRGDSLRLGEGLGAALSRSMDRFYGHPMPVLHPPLDPRRDPLALLTCSAFYAAHALVVNTGGERFADEGEAESRGTLARAIASQSGGIAWAIMDHEVRRRFGLRLLVGGLLPPIDLLKAAARRGATIVRARTLEGLAEGLSRAGVDGRRLLRTVEEFNEALARQAAAQLEVPRRIHAHPVTTPPFYAVKVVPGVTMTYGGLAIDPEARVLDAQGKPLRGIFAVPGAAGGLYFHEYGGALAACGTFGRVAGRGAARYAQTAVHPTP